MNYPIAETFVAPQGEGYWAGTLMTFIRLAGCNVGRAFTEAERIEGNLAQYQEKCTAWDGVSFACDTNYAVAGRVSLQTLMETVAPGPEHVCITGGEPLIHDLELLISLLVSKGKHVHIETSGTKDLPRYLLSYQTADNGTRNPWVTVSPKHGFLMDVVDRAAEIKVLVGSKFDATVFAFTFGGYMHKVWLQPINDLHSLRQESIAKCLELQRLFPSVRISVQLHKILGTR